MATYSTNLALTLINTGDQAGTWGITTNTNLGTLLEQAISGYVTQAITDGADTTITIPNGATGVARNMYIECTGTLTANRNLVVPANKKLYFIYNNTSGGFAVTVKVAGQTGVSVPNGEKKILVSNGTDIVEATSYSSLPSSLTLTTLTATSANITTLTGTSANITTLTGTAFSPTTLTATSANITTLTGTSANITTLTGTAFSPTTLTATSANITTATGTRVAYTSGTITNLSSTSANITTLTGTNASFTSLTLTNALKTAEGGTGVDSTPTNGQLLIGNGSGFALSTLTAGSGMTITNNAGSITLAAAGLPVVTVTSSTAISASAGNHYVLTGTSTTITLPASPTISDTVYITVANSLTTNVVARNGKPIQGIAEDMTLDAPYASAQLRFTNNTVGWVLT